METSKMVLVEFTLESGARYSKLYDSLTEAYIDAFRMGLEVSPVVRITEKKV